MHRTSQAALAGVAAAAVWVTVEPVWRRLLGGPQRELRLVGRLLAPESLWKPVGLAMHLANGAAFGVAFDRLGGRGVGQAVAAAQIENAVLWPTMAIVDRLHPDVRDGTWPSLVDNPRALGQEIAGHAVFGVVLGLLGPGPRAIPETAE
jgi:hypothetical protein